MLAKLAVLAHSKIAAAVLGLFLVGGSGTVAVVAANGSLPVFQSSHSTTTSQQGRSDDHGDNGDHAVNLEGTLTAIDDNTATITVLPEHATTPVTVTVNANTRVNGEHANRLADLANNIGHKVEVEADKESDGTLLATKITVQGAVPADQDQHELHGAITSIGTDSFVLKPATGAAVTVTITTQTTFKDDTHGLSGLKVGEQVEVKGAPQSNGTFAAASVEGQTGDDGGSGGSGSGDGGSDG